MSLLLSGSQPDFKWYHGIRNDNNVRAKGWIACPDNNGLYTYYTAAVRTSSKTASGCQASESVNIYEPVRHTYEKMRYVHNI